MHSSMSLARLWAPPFRSRVRYPRWTSAFTDGGIGEGYLLQANTSALGEDRLLAVLDFAVSQQPIYFDPDRRVDTADSGAKPLICKVEAGELRCSSFQKVLNQFQYCRSYEEFFGTGILLTASQGPNCMLFTVAVEPL